MYVYYMEILNKVTGEVKNKCLTYKFPVNFKNVNTLNVLLLFYKQLLELYNTNIYHKQEYVITLKIADVTHKTFDYDIILQHIDCIDCYMGKLTNDKLFNITDINAREINIINKDQLEALISFYKVSINGQCGSSIREDLQLCF